MSNYFDHMSVHEVTLGLLTSCQFYDLLIHHSLCLAKSLACCLKPFSCLLGLVSDYLTLKSVQGSCMSHTSYRSRQVCTLSPSLDIRNFVSFFNFLGIIKKTCQQL